MTAARATLGDVARTVGLSINTVSRALAGKDQVSESTRARIVSAARDLGYVPNRHARSLVSGTTMVIGLVITNPSNPYIADLISAIERRCRLAGYTVLLLVTEESQDSETSAVEHLLSYGVDGVIGVPVQGDPHPWERLVSGGVPTVLVSRDLPDLDLDFVGTDVERGVADAVAVVAGRNTRTAWLFEEDLNITTTTDRIAGFRRGLAVARVSDDDVKVVTVPTERDGPAARSWRPDDAYRLAVELLRHAQPPDLVVAGNDMFALGVQRAVKERGFRVPEQTSILGYGDHPFAAYVEPALSTIQIPVAQIGQLAVERVVARIADPAGKKQSTLLRPTLLQRDSTSPAIAVAPTRTSSRRRR